MSFLSILKKFGNTALGIEQAAEPFITTLIPASAGVFAVIDPIFARLKQAVVTVEANSPGTPGNLKSDAVIADFEAALSVAQSIADARGETLQYDKLALQTAINSEVAALNAMALVKASFKFVPKVPATS